MSDDGLDTQRLRRIVREETGEIAQKYKAIEFLAMAADLDELRQRLAECHALLVAVQAQIERALELTTLAGTADENG